LASRKVGFHKPGLPQVGSYKAGFPKVGSPKGGLFKVGVIKVGVIKVGAIKVNSLKVGFHKIGARKVGSRKVRYNGCMFFSPFIPILYSGFQQMELLRTTSSYRKQQQKGNYAFVATNHNNHRVSLHALSYLFSFSGKWLQVTPAFY
jgi:hypothetical protein